MDVTTQTQARKGGSARSKGKQVRDTLAQRKDMKHVQNYAISRYGGLDIKTCIYLIQFAGIRNIEEEEGAEELNPNHERARGFLTEKRRRVKWGSLNLCCQFRSFCQ